MHKPIVALKWSTTIWVVLTVQLITALMLGMNLIAASSGSVAAANLIPPVAFLYVPDSMWIGMGRVAGHVLASVMNVVIGILCLWYGLQRHLRIVKYVTVAMGIQMLLSAFVNASLIAVIIWGGWWHIAAFVAIVVMSLASTATAVIFFLVRNHLLAIGEAHDSLIEPQRDGA